MYLRYLALLFVCCAAEHLTAQQVTPCKLVTAAPMPINFYGTNEGLSQGMMNAMAIDSDGYLWLATNAGLNRFDGRTFKVYRNRPGDSTSIAGNHILALHVDAQNRIWMCTESKGIDCFTRNTETFTHYTTADGLSTNTTHGDVFTNDRHGQLIIMHEQDKPADIIVPGNGKGGFVIKKLASVYPGIAKVTGAKRIQSFVFTATGDAWYNTYDSLYHLTEAGLKSTGKYEAFAGNGSGIFTDASKQLVYWPDTNTLSIYSGSKRKFEALLKLPPGYKFRGPTMDAEGEIWFMHANGRLLRINLRLNQMQEIDLVTTPDIKKLIPHAHVWLKDKFGNVFLGTTGWGFIKVNTRCELFKHTTENSLANNIFPFAQFRVVMPGVKALFDPAISGEWLQTRNLSALKKNSLFYTQYGPVIRDSAGAYLFPLNSNAGRMFLVNIFPGGTASQVITTHAGDGEHWFYTPFIIDKHNKLWYSERSLSDSVRLFRFDKGTGKEDSFAFPVKYDAVSYAFVSDWEEDKDELWLATCKGLFAFNMQTYTWKNYTYDRALGEARLLSLCADPVLPARYLWIGSAGGGLYKLEKSTGKYITYTTANGLPDNIIYSIQTDKRNNLWLGTGNGLCLFNPVNLQATNFSLSDGLPGTDFNTGMYSKSATGELYFGCVGGNFHFNPEDFYKPLAKAKIAITQLKLLNKPIDYMPDGDSASSFHLPAPIEQVKELVFNYDQRMISFNFSLLDLTNPAKSKYKYMLQDLNQDWIDNGYNNEAVFTNLSPGHYLLKVMGQSSSGVWSEPLSLAIVIRSPWWATWWFRCLAALFVAGALYAGYRYRLEQLLRMERMRNQIAQDLHDEIGSTLSSISLYSVVMQNSPEIKSGSTNAVLNKIIDSTSQMMESMNDMVWTIKADNDSFEQVINRMRAFAVNVTEAKGIELHFTADRQTGKLELDMSQRKNIYLIFKEAVNNAVKYSNCKNLRINIAHANRTLRLAIEDDGTGFDLDVALDNTQLLGGNGLRGMQARAKEINGNLQIVSAPGKGTCINFTMPV